ncbi:MAG: glutaredoxin family protein [Gammaproteobacteria bacterium]|nr:glutaredoxin family protein [Gammaproteobacteria bacterium]
MAAGYTVYVRHGCHLCEAMTTRLRQRGIAFTEVDIDADAGLRREYNDRVPVLTRDGEFVCQYFLDEALL